MAGSSETQVYDFAIVGGGVAGASLAYFLAPRGAVAVLEREDALGYHATGRSAAEFTHRFHSGIAGKLTGASYGFFTAPPDGFSDVALLRRRGNLLIASHEKAARLGEVCAAERDAAPAGAAPLLRLSVDEALARAPFLRRDYLAGALYDADCWDIEVESLLQGFVRGAKAHGADFRLKSDLRAARREGDAWRLETAGGEVRARVAVNAAGAWADAVAATLGAAPLGLTPYRRTAISVAAPGFDLTHAPEVNEIDEDFYFKPDAGRLLVSPADETPVDPHDAWPEEIDIAYAAHYLGECTEIEVTRVAHSWAGLRTFAPDRAPVVGFSADAPGMFWLAGQGGFGMQASPGLARWAAAALLGEPPPDDMISLGLSVEALSPARLGG